MAGSEWRGDAELSVVLKTKVKPAELPNAQVVFFETRMWRHGRGGGMCVVMLETEVIRQSSPMRKLYSQHHSARDATRALVQSIRNIL